jgi:hypothetical protein
MLRVLFSRLGKPHIGSSNAFSFNVPSIRATGVITIEKGGAVAPVPGISAFFPGYSPVTRPESAPSARGSLE